MDRGTMTADQPSASNLSQSRAASYYQNGTPPDTPNMKGKTNEKGRQRRKTRIVRADTLDNRVLLNTVEQYASSPSRFVR